MHTSARLTTDDNDYERRDLTPTTSERLVAMKYAGGINAQWKWDWHCPLRRGLYYGFTPSSAILLWQLA